MKRAISIRSAFTLIELMVVVAIVAILIAILVPSLSRARKQAFRLKCAANLRGIGQAVMFYVNDEKGYLPFIEEHGGHWAAQIARFLPIKRSRVESRDGFLRCPADRYPPYFHLTGKMAGEEASERDKIESDTGTGDRSRGRRTGTQSPTVAAAVTAGPLIEPISYGGSSDRYLVLYPFSTRQRLWRTVKLTELDRPYCQTLLSEMRSYGWADIVKWRDWYADPARRRFAMRHYGGPSPYRNGTNWLLADGHVDWYALGSVDTLFCCQDFEHNARQALIDLQRLVCKQNRENRDEDPRRRR